MKFIQVNIPNRDCRGITLMVDDTFIKDEISDAKEFKPASDFTMMLRVTSQSGLRRIQKKKTHKFNKKQTLLQAVDTMIDYRTEITKLLKDGTITKHRDLKAIGINKDLGGQSTLNEIFADYTETKKSVLKEKTIKSYVGFYNTWVKEAIGSKPIKEITQEQLQAIVNMVLRDRAPKTAKTLKEVLNPIFKQYWRRGEIKSNPVELLVFKKFDNVVNPDLADDEIKRLYEEIYDYDAEPYRSIFIWLSTGRRVNEVLSLRWEDINMAKKEFTITADNNKAGRSMTYHMDDDLMGTLKDIKSRTGYLFPAIKDPNNKMHNDTLKRHWKKILENANIEHLRIHDLRHIVGLKLVNAGVSLEVIASVLGHTTVSITKRYSKVRTETASKAMEKFKELIKEIPNMD